MKKAILEAALRVLTCTAWLPFLLTGVNAENPFLDKWSGFLITLVTGLLLCWFLVSKFILWLIHNNYKIIIVSAYIAVLSIYWLHSIVEPWVLWCLLIAILLAGPTALVGSVIAAIRGFGTLVEGRYNS